MTSFFSSHTNNDEIIRTKFVSIIKRLLPKSVQHEENMDLKEFKNNSIGSNSFKKFPPINMNDLYNTLRYSLYYEVTRYAELNSTQIDAIKKYMITLYKYFPFDNENARRFFKRMNQWFANKTNSLKVVDLNAAFKISDGYIHPMVEWRHCTGGQSVYYL